MMQDIGHWEFSILFSRGITRTLVAVTGPSLKIITPVVGPVACLWRTIIEYASKNNVVTATFTAFEVRVRINYFRDVIEISFYYSSIWS